MAVSKRVRYEVLRRDNHQCRYCGGAAPDVALTVDHVVPVALGGSDDPSNLVAACRDCNAGKTSTSPDSNIVADVSADAIRWAEALKQAAVERAAEFENKRATEAGFRELWEVWTAGGRPLDLPLDFGASVRQFLAAGLTFADLDELVDVAMTAKTIRGAAATWKYFCGCCWKRVRQAQEHASHIVAQWEQGEDEDENYEVSEAEYFWSGIAVQWREETGTRLRACICLDPCGKDECVMHVAGLAQGALLGIAEITQYITKQESGSAPQAEEATDGA